MHWTCAVTDRRRQRQSVGGGHGQGGTTYLTVVNRGTSATTVNVDLSGISGVSGGTATVLTGNPAAMNSLGHPTAISPVTHPVGPQGADFRYTFPASSLTVLALSTQ